MNIIYTFQIFIKFREIVINSNSTSVFPKDTAISKQIIASNEEIGVTFDRKNKELFKQKNECFCLDYNKTCKTIFAFSKPHHYDGR